MFRVWPFKQVRVLFSEYDLLVIKNSLNLKAPKSNHKVIFNIADLSDTNNGKNLKSSFYKQLATQKTNSETMTSAK